MSQKKLRGELSVPGDKSISHRAVMIGSLAEGTTRIRHFLQGADCLSTIRCFRQMGVNIEDAGDEILVHGRGLFSLEKPSGTLDTGNSGTTMRLLSGILCAQSFSSRLTGDASVCTRPMKRIIEPLTQMGASIASEMGNGCAPLLLSPSALHGIDYLSPVASAQVKSCILLAGLYADGMTSVTEKSLSRNHTELMLRSFGASVTSHDTTAVIIPGSMLHAQSISVPGDISSAAYFIAAASILPGSELLLKGVGINPTRDGMLRVCRMMGADVTLLDQKKEGGEPVADLLVRSSSLHGCVIEGDLIPALIDELPVIAVMGAFARGTTIIRDAAELKVKESDRIAVMTDNLSRMGADAAATEDGMIIHGGKTLTGAVIDPHLDHRIAMSFAVAALAARGETTILGRSCVDISYPGFFDELDRCMTD